MDEPRTSVPKRSSDGEGHLRRLFAEMACVAPGEILEPLWTPEAANQRFEDFDAANAKEYYLYTVLIEVQRAGLAMTRWSEFLESPDLTAWPAALLLHEVGSRISEQSVWHRKLVEVLVHLIAFSQTPEPEYFYHYLVTARLQETLYQQQEQREFFDASSEYLAVKADKQRDLLRQLPVDWKRAWYLADGVESHTLQKRRPPLLATTKALTKRALLLGSAMERRNLGYCYRNAFSSPSSTIHFEPLPWDGRARDLDHFKVGFLHAGFLCADAIMRVLQLLGITRTTPCCRLAEQVASTEVMIGLVGSARPGDFVIVMLSRKVPALARVESVVQSPYGNESYRIRYLETPPPAGVASDIVPSDLVVVFQQRGPLREGLVQRLREAAEGTAKLSLSEDEIEVLLSEAVKDVWDLAYRDLYVRRLTVEQP